MCITLNIVCIYLYLICFCCCFINRKWQRNECITLTLSKMLLYFVATIVQSALGKTPKNLNSKFYFWHFCETKFQFISKISKFFNKNDPNKSSTEGTWNNCWNTLNFQKVLFFTWICILNGRTKILLENWQ